MRNLKTQLQTTAWGFKTPENGTLKHVICISCTGLQQCKETVFPVAAVTAAAVSCDRKIQQVAVHSVSETGCSGTHESAQRADRRKQRLSIGRCHEREERGNVLILCVGLAHLYACETRLLMFFLFLQYTVNSMSTATGTSKFAKKLCDSTECYSISHNAMCSSPLIFNPTTVSHKDKVFTHITQWTSYRYSSNRHSEWSMVIVWWFDCKMARWFTICWWKTEELWCGRRIPHFTHSPHVSTMPGCPFRAGLHSRI